jgi:UDP-N-acetylmuramoyl-tripeptide--D-alanyl-D-alanine ligase
MIAMTLSEATHTLGGRLVGGDGIFRGVSTDSRTISEGELFVALRGPRFNGEDMLDEAFSKGAAGAIVRDATLTREPVIQVSNTLDALGVLAKAWRLRFDIPIVGITGSVGKTTVKEMLGSILSLSGRTLITTKNFNNEIGVAQTLLQLSDQHEFAVLELGARKPKDIQLLSEVCRPTVGVVTLCAPAHLDGFVDLKTVAKSKGELFTSLPEEGVGIVNLEDPYARMWQSMVGPRKFLTFGDGGDVCACDVSYTEAGLSFELVLRDHCPRKILLRHKGIHNVTNALAAAAAALAIGVDIATIEKGLNSVREADQRLSSRVGIYKSHLIDDSYNANPTSVRAAIDVLAAEQGSQWLVLGDMGELGEEGEKFHIEVGRYAAVENLERLFTIGELSAYSSKAFGEGARHFENRLELQNFLFAELRNSSNHVTILVKGSRFMGLNKLVDALSFERCQSC